MKKALAILMAIAMIVPAVFATGPAPEVTFGLSADAEVQMIKENTTNTFETSGKEAQPKAAFNPMGLQATKFVSNDWVNFDWALMSIKAEGKYDAWRADDTDYSWLKVSATWKDLFGFKIAYEYNQDNKEDNVTDATAVPPKVSDAIPTQILDKNYGNNITATYDKDGVKFWTKYTPNDVLSMLSVSPHVNSDNFLKDFKEIGFEFTNDEIATKLVYKNTPGDKIVGTDTVGTATIDAATLEAKNLFGFWTVLLNNSDEIGYRIGNLGSDSKLDRSEYKIGKDNKIQSATAANQKLNAKNTMKFGENLTVKATLVVPNAGDEISDWLAGDNMIVGAEYVLADVGTIGTGLKIKQDYVGSTDGLKSMPSLMGANYVALATAIAGGDAAAIAAAYKTAAAPVWGNAFWLDAKLDKLLGEDKAVFVGVDAQFGAYAKIDESNKEWAKDTANEKVDELIVGMATKVNLYGETKMKLSDMISFSAGTLFSLGTGYDYKSVYGTSWSDANTENKDTTWYSGNTEANDLNAVYGIKPFELKARVDVKVNDTVSVWVSDNFVANDGALPAAPTGGKAVDGYYQKNVLGLGAKLKATEKSSLTVSTDVNMFLGTPSSSDLYLNGATDAQKKALDSAVAAWKTEKFNPFAVKVAYSYAY